MSWYSPQMCTKRNLSMREREVRCQMTLLGQADMICALKEELAFCSVSRQRLAAYIAQAGQKLTVFWPHHPAARSTDMNPIPCG